MAPPFPLSNRAADVRPGCKTQRIAPTFRQIANLLCVRIKKREYFKTCIVGHVNCCLQCWPTFTVRCPATSWPDNLRYKTGLVFRAATVSRIMRGHVMVPSFPLSNRATDVRPGCETQRIAPTLREVADFVGIGGTVVSESAMRCAGTLLSRVRAPLPAPWPDGGPKA
ncbi:hypothetical protein PoB_005728400 [Plakobranchus ocellatus]|uniref:Uncharacterized protein n=1 Tax=Plakobranchus ocellatus TaxID=259542 RepID=A0AAV4CIV3_9GAST|nr:hypothetical protein PoB_005728400 [Plakobranchus ocellatus]